MSIFNKVTKTFQWGPHTVTLETGEVARQSSGAVVVNIDDTVVLATVVASKTAKPGQDFFPLTVDYTEKTYAAGKIPGSFFKREGRPSELEILTCRLIDRPIRPLFPEGFYNEVQVIVHVLSLNPEVQADIAAMIGTSAALAISGIPFDGPIGAARVGYVNGEYVLNPGKTQLLDSKLDLVVAGTEAAVLMVESEADMLSEEIMLGAVVFGHEQGNIAIRHINELVRDAGKPEWDWKAPAKDEAFIAKLNALAEEPLRAAYQIRSKQARTQACREAYANVLAALKSEGAEFDAVKVESMLFDIEARIVRSQILAGEPRIDGRDTRTVRAIEIRNGVLPRTHGSALFTRGETQALVVATLGTERDAQRIDALAGEFTDNFMLHYNMPPFATGEAGRFGSPKRREIGHGRLAKRALLAALPKKEDFPYTMRVVSEITESNGSSSMASVCGGCLALMDAGVPMKAHVAGIAMGLIKDANRFAVLTDILGDEDHLGDMDFKVAGTTSGITALQMDIKIQGITKEIMQVALAQAKEARLHILGKMQEADGRGQGRGVAVRAAPVHDEDQPGEDPRRHRQGRRGDPRADRGNRLRHRHRRGRHHHHRLDRCRQGRVRQEAHHRDHGRGRGRQGLRRRGHQAAGLRRAGQHPAGQGRVAAHQPDRAPARREGHRLPRRRPGGQGQGAGDRREGPHQAVDEGAARASRGHGRRARAPAAPRVR